MSYDNMDHAGWVERNGEASKQQRAKRKTNKEGRPVGWHAMPVTLSRFQRRVMDICGVAMGGIYNAPIVWESVDWGGEDGRQGMWIPLDRDRSLASWDFSELTTLTLLAHMARIRFSVEGGGVGRLVLAFWQRSHQGGSSERHPDLLERLAEFEKRFPPDHPIRYRADLDDLVPQRRLAFLTLLADKTDEVLEAEITRRADEAPPAWMKPEQQAQFRLNQLSGFESDLRRDKERAAVAAGDLGTGGACLLRDAIIASRDRAAALLAQHVEKASEALERAKADAERPKAT